MKTTFPFQNRLSFVIGYFKVDPAFAKHRAAHGYAFPAIPLDDPNEITLSAAKCRLGSDLSGGLRI